MHWSNDTGGDAPLINFSKLTVVQKKGVYKTLLRLYVKPLHEVFIEDFGLTPQAMERLICAALRDYIIHEYKDRRFYGCDNFYFGEYIMTEEFSFIARLLEDWERKKMGGLYKPDSRNLSEYLNKVARAIKKSGGAKLIRKLRGLLTAAK